MPGDAGGFSVLVREPVKIDVWSDIACPWCYIGKRRLEAGAASAGVPIEVEYHSFELAPDTPVDFEGSEADFLAGRKGVSGAQAQTMLDQVTAVAADAGLEYRFDDVHHTRTLLAHEVLHLAKARGRQLEVAEALFRAYFTEGRHLGRIEDLAAIAAASGLDTADVRAALADHRYAGDVQADIAQAAAYDVRGVPFFVVDGRWGVAGAQPAEVFADVLRTAAAERAGAR